jgi:hypothetical protein
VGNKLTYDAVLNLSHEELANLFMGLYVEVKEMQVKMDELVSKLDNIKNGWQKIKESDSYKFVEEKRKSRN